MPLVADESLPGAAMYQNVLGKSTDGGLFYRRAAPAGGYPRPVKSARAAAGERHAQGRQEHQYRNTPRHTRNPVHGVSIQES
jgi:hypothetical protein